MKNTDKADLDKKRPISHHGYSLTEYDYILPEFHFLKSFWNTDMSDFITFFQAYEYLSGAFDLAETL